MKNKDFESITNILEDKTLIKSFIILWTLETANQE
jgi:hypothetical protein